MSRFVDYAIESAQLYYEYLERTGKGVMSVGVKKIEARKGAIILFLSKRFKGGDIEQVELKIHDEIYSKKEINPVYYDSKKAVLLIRPCDKLREDIALRKPSELTVISDLKYLVKRVEDWYREYGKNIKPPAMHDNSAGEPVFTYSTPSPEQMKAIRSVLNNPFTYIWGAPGTGKTRLVLANCALHYAKQGKRILLVAPTNNAIEQVLRGVIPMLNQAGIPHERIVRLGTPSNRFLREYPEICEESGLNKMLKQVDEQIKNLEKVLRLRKKSEKIQGGLSAQISIYDTESDDALQARIFRMTTEYDRLHKHNIAVRIQDAYIVACTVDGYIYRLAPGFDELTEDDEHFFNHVFMDEAGYCSLIKGATMLAQNCPITYLGDHKQLPPVCEANDTDFYGNLSPLSLWAQSAIFAETVFEEDIEHISKDYLQGTEPPFVHLKKYNLTKGFRFGQELAEILDDYVYHNGFDSANKELPFHFTVLDAPGRDGLNKRENPSEARTIARYLEENRTLLGSYVILSPYTNQVRLLGEYLPLERARMQIMTVHSSQGQEWDTVMLSVSDYGNNWFTDSSNRASKGILVLNTAISRTKKHFILVCDANYWSYQPNQLLGAMVRRAGY